jgi:hypothetical protein
MTGDELLFGGEGGPGPRRAPSQAGRLVKLALESYELGISATGDPFGVARKGPRIARLLRGNTRSLRAEISGAYFDTFGQVPSSSALADALTTLEGFARRCEPTCLYLRYADTGDVLWADLGDQSGQAVRTDTDAWTVEASAPVTFRRSELTAALPDPVAGDVAELRHYLNVTDEGWALILGWLVSALFPNVPHPILVLTGEQGTAKSTAARLLTAIVDPSPAPLRTSPRDVGEWVTVADGSAVVGLDNVSGLPVWLSDALCRAVTGDGLPRRALCSDADLVVTAFRKIIILTGIDLGTLSPDLVDRALFVELQRIPRGQKMLDSEIERTFADAQPRILGGLLDLVAATRRALPDVELEAYPRMADHARILAALDAANDGGHLEAYEHAAGRAIIDAVDGSPVASAIIAHMANREQWTGTASELLAAITPDKPPHRWPSAPNVLSGMVKRLAPALRANGVSVDYERMADEHRTRIIVLTTGEWTLDGLDDDSHLPL